MVTRLVNRLSCIGSEVFIAQHINSHIKRVCLHDGNAISPGEQSLAGCLVGYSIVLGHLIFYSHNDTFARGYSKSSANDWGRAGPAAAT
jgi:hypothetical protein